MLSESSWMINDFTKLVIFYLLLFLIFIYAFTPLESIILTNPVHQEKIQYIKSEVTNSKSNREHTLNTNAFCFKSDNKNDNLW